MAKAPVAASTPEVDQWITSTLELINAASAYAASGEDDPNTAAMIRQLRVVCAAFMAALQTLSIPR